MRREKSDGFMVPKSRRKADAPSDRIGTGTTANEQTGQLDLLDGTAASLKPARAMRVDDEGAGRPRSSPLPMPPPSSAKSENLSAMTMEAVATDVNLRRAFTSEMVCDVKPSSLVGEQRIGAQGLLRPSLHQSYPAPSVLWPPPSDAQASLGFSPRAWASQAEVEERRRSQRLPCHQIVKRDRICDPECP
jgi:hypothetical protein